MNLPNKPEIKNQHIEDCDDISIDLKFLPSIYEDIEFEESSRIVEGYLSEDELSDILESTNYMEKFKPILYLRPQEIFEDFDKQYLLSISDVQRHLAGEIIQPRSIYETSLERFENRLMRLEENVATKQDIINQTGILISVHKQTIEDLQKKIEILRSLQQSNVSHKRLRKYSLLFLIFFIGSLLTNLIFGVTIVLPLWNNLGILFSFGFFIMSWVMGIDWKESTGKGDR